MLIGITVVLFEMLQWQLLSPLCFSTYEHLFFHLVICCACNDVLYRDHRNHTCSTYVGCTFLNALEGLVEHIYKYIFFEWLCTTYIYSIVCYFTNRQDALHLLVRIIYTHSLQCEYGDTYFLTAFFFFFYDHTVCLLYITVAHVCL